MRDHAASFRTAGRSPFVLASFAGLALSALVGCQSGGTGPGDVSGRYILSLCDADMPATAFVDNLLGARNPEDKDMVTLIGLPMADGKDDRYVTPYAQIPVSNSVIGPPQAVAVTMDGRWAYIVENHGPAPMNATTTDDLPIGNKLTRLDLTDPMAPVEAGVATVGNEPMAVDISPDGQYLCVVTKENRKQISIIPISEGGMGEALDWPLIGLDDDGNTVPSCVVWHPSGEFIAVTVPNTNQVVFYRVTRGAGSIGLIAWGEPVRVGQYPYSGRFTPDGRFFITTDMQWGQEVPGMFIEPPQGQLSVIRFNAAAPEATEGGAPAPVTHEVVAAAPVGVNPEGLAISPDGSMVVTANLIRSFLPETDPRVTRGGSLSLLSMDRSTGTLTPIEEYPINSMPVGLSFDAKGNFVVVSQFRSFDPAVVTGELAFFAVRGGSRPSLEKADFWVGVGKGPHGVLIVR